LDKRFLVELKGKEFVQYAGLLDLAHQQGLAELKVEILQFPSQENGMECIVKATAITGAGMFFCDIGDANPGNTNKAVAQHIIRMASTRAKARVLRDMTNIGMTALEELGDDVGDMCSGYGNGGRGKTGIQQRKGSGGKKKPSKAGNGFVPMTDAQKRAIQNLAKRKGYAEDTLHTQAEEAFGCGLDKLSKDDAAAFIVQLQEPAAAVNQ
jgi:hypothetical protein